MEITRLDTQVSISPQIRADELDDVARQGFRMLINNRPDGEEAGQPTSAEIEAAARRVGLDYRYIPITPGCLTIEEALAFSNAVRAAGGPILAFCRTGTRSGKLWKAMQELPSGEGS
jgi:sulfide:quinone oxidoreductase